MLLLLLFSLLLLLLLFYVVVIVFVVLLVVVFVDASIRVVARCLVLFLLFAHRVSYVFLLDR